MADIEIGSTGGVVPDAAALTGTETFYGRQGGTTVAITAAQLGDAVGARRLRHIGANLYGDPTPVRLVRVETGAEMRAAFLDAQPGDVIEYGEKEFDGPLRIDAHGTAANRITIRPKQTGRPGTFGFNLVLGGSYIDVISPDLVPSAGIFCDGENDPGIDGSDCRIIGVEAVDRDGAVVEMTNGAARNEVLYSHFDNIKGPGVSVQLNDNVESQSTFGNRIAYCAFRNFRTPEVNGSEPIRVGSSTHSTNWDVATIIEYCHFYNCVRDDEVVSFKSSGNTLRYSVIEECRRVEGGNGSGPSLRHGNDNKFHGNHLTNTHALWVWGDRAEVISNEFDSSGDIRIMAGDTTQDDLAGLGTGYPAARNCLVADNDLGGASSIVVGDTTSGTPDTAATLNQVIGNRNGLVVLGLESNTTQSTDPYLGTTYTPVDPGLLDARLAPDLRDRIRAQSADGSWYVLASPPDGGGSAVWSAL